MKKKIDHIKTHTTWLTEQEILEWFKEFELPLCGGGEPTERYYEDTVLGWRAGFVDKYFNMIEARRKETGLKQYVL